MISLPSPLKITKKKDDWAQFVIDGLYPGYGVTVGNSLRRVLLSSLPGAAVVQMKIKGIQHEFSTIPGILEDVITIMLNLKQLRFKMYAEEPLTASLSIKGEKKVKGSDFKFPSQIELINKNSHIATMTDKKAELEMEILIKKGTGYEPIERRKKEKLEVGVIALDAIFSPIKKVSYDIENMRVGERTDFDRLFLEIETDGTITPQGAFFQSLEILIKHFSLFFENLKEKMPSSLPEVKTKQRKKPKAAVKTSVKAVKTVKKHEKKKKRKKI